jgi:hypothetical protein
MVAKHGNGISASTVSGRESFACTRGSVWKIPLFTPLVINMRNCSLGKERKAWMRRSILFSRHKTCQGLEPIQGSHTPQAVNTRRDEVKERLFQYF